MTRTVSLVVSHDGRVLGQLPSFEVGTPWWQDVEPIVLRYPDLAVLRLLDVRHEPGVFVGGHVTYLVEPSSQGPPSSELPGQLTKWPGSLSDDPRRMPWAMPA